MISKFKSYLIIIGTILTIMGTSYGLIMKIKYDKESNERSKLEDELVVKTTEVTSYKNKLGKKVTKTIEYEKTIKQLKNSTDSIEIQLFKTLKASSLKEKQIKSLTKIIASGGSGGKYFYIDTVFLTDTIFKGTIKKYEDEFIKINCYEDSINYFTNLKLDIITASRKIPRKFQPIKWINKNWIIKKTIDKNQVEVTTNIPNSELILRRIKVNRYQ